MFEHLFVFAFILFSIILQCFFNNELKKLFAVLSLYLINSTIVMFFKTIQTLFLLIWNWIQKIKITFVIFTLKTKKRFF